MNYIKITAFLAGCVIAAGLILPGCGKDDPVQPATTKQAVQFKDLTQKDDVLFNLQLSYNERTSNEYEKLLDDGFRFYFAWFDVQYRGTLESWDRVAEVVANAKILNQNLSGDKRVISIDLHLDYPNTNWTEESAPPSHDGEKWYNNTVMYDLTVKTADDWEYRASEKYIKIILRWDEVQDHWRIVEMRDGVAPRGPGYASTLGIKPFYWGTFKAGLAP